jgi:hypothetical protein
MAITRVCQTEISNPYPRPLRIRVADPVLAFLAMSLTGP